MSNTRKLIFYSLCSVILVVSKEVLAFLPNIELVSLLLIIFTLNLGLKVGVLISSIFSLLQMLLYGISFWSLFYLVIWAILCLFTYLLRKYLTNYDRVAIFSGFYGLIFGLLFSIPYFLISVQAGISYYTLGITFDLVHCLGNYLLAVLLFDRLNNVFKYLANKYLLC